MVASFDHGDGDAGCHGNKTYMSIVVYVAMLGRPSAGDMMAMLVVMVTSQPRIVLDVVATVMRLRRTIVTE